MIKIDNSGKGNCMYYAYSISLMYFLLHKKNTSLNKELFTRLHLEQQQQDQLNQLLNEINSGIFSKHAITTIIEPILGSATRQRTAEQIEADFKNNPKGSSLYATMNYAMLYHFYQQAKNHSFPWLSCLDKYQFNDPAFTEADVFGVFNTEQLVQFSEKEYGTLVQQFADGWDKHVAQMSTQHTCNHEEIEANPIHKKIFWETLVEQFTINFFLQNNTLRLNTYTTYLKTDRIWGNVEQLNILHAYLQGEENKNNEIIYNTPISLGIYSNGILHSGTPCSQSIDIKLNNEDNNHWVSFVHIDNNLAYITLLDRLAQQAKISKTNEPEEAQRAVKVYHLLLETKERFLSSSLVWLNNFTEESSVIINKSLKSKLRNYALKKILNDLLLCIQAIAQDPKFKVLNRVNNIEYEINNDQKIRSGAEDGIYHAYSLSLMFFLIRQKDKNLNNKLFNRLHLNNIELEKLNTLLDNIEYDRFTEKDITTIIEPILGRATRIIVAKKIKQDFIANPDKSSLYTLMKYELLHQFHNLNHSDSTPLIEHSKIPLRFSKEKVSSVFSATQLEQFVTEQYPLLKEQFNKEWNNYVSHVYEEGIFTKEQINTSSFYKRLLFNKLVGEQTKEFFCKNNYQHLNEYITYLKTNKTYGNADTIYTLHSCIHDSNDDTVSISLRVNDTLLDGDNLKESIGIILDEKCATPLMAAYDPLQFFHPTPIIDERNDILSRYGFNNALKQLQAQLTALEEKKYDTAAKQTATIYNSLTKIRTIYLSKRTMNLHDFTHACQHVLKTEPRSELKIHRGVLKILNDFLNIIFSLANKSIGFFSKQYQAIELDKISTKTANSVSRLEHSIDTLLKIEQKTYERVLLKKQLNTDSTIEKTLNDPDKDSHNTSSVHINTP